MRSASWREEVASAVAAFVELRATAAAATASTAVADDSGEVYGCLGSRCHVQRPLAVQRRRWCVLILAKRILQRVRRLLVDRLPVAQIFLQHLQAAAGLFELLHPRLVEWRHQKLNEARLRFVNLRRLAVHEWRRRQAVVLLQVALVEELGRNALRPLQVRLGRLGRVPNVGALQRNLQQQHLVVFLVHIEARLAQHLRLEQARQLEMLAEVGAQYHVYYHLAKAANVGAVQGGQDGVFVGGRSGIGGRGRSRNIVPRRATTTAAATTTSAGTEAVATTTNTTATAAAAAVAVSNQSERRHQVMVL
mmetsp:Transcript_4362/g.10608  ORF Transcript_4362/g.10608 Transcript_4362/m.10608 type:complete len:306 (-) Transcript_4362:993-1910(-)